MCRTLLAFLLLLLVATNAWSQSTAQINGAVADSSGAVLPGATVVAINIDTGFRRDVVTDDKGSFTLSNLPIGPYRLEVTLSGFRTYVQTGIVLQVNANPVFKATMELGEVAETVTVVGVSPLVEIRNPAVGQVIENARIEALPLEGRNPTSLIALAGASADTGTPSSRSMTTSRGIAIAGGQAFGVAYFLDGATHNNVFDGFNMPLPFPDALQEFRVETSSQNAQNGLHAGGTVSVVTKSGTNAFHGDLFEFARHHRFNATSPFAGINAATGKRLDDGLVRNQYGGTVGGPVLRDKLFFFGAYQGSRATQTPADTVTFVPTAAMLAGDFTQVASAACNAAGAISLRAPFANNRIDPAKFSPAALNIAKVLPSTTDPCGRTTYSRQTKPREGQTIGKFDWQFSQNHSVFARYIGTTTFWDPAYANTGNILATTLGGRNSSARSLAIGDTMVLSNTVVNNVRFTVHRTDIHRTHTDFFGPQDFGINTFSYPGKVTLVTVTGGFTLGTGTETDSWYRPNTYAFSDDLTMVQGNHQFGFGGTVSLSDWKALSNVRSPGAFTFNGGGTGLGLADFMVGNVFEFRQATPFRLDATQRNFGLYGQDTWRLSSAMTMNYGVRWEPWFPQQHQNNAVYNFSAERLLAGQRSKVYPQAPPGFLYPGDEGFPGKAGLSPDWLNIQPRVGVSWDPNGAGRTVVRAGYGLNADFIAGQYFFDASQAPPFGYEERLTRPAVGRFEDPFGGIGRTNPFPVTLDANVPFGPGGLYIQIPQDLKNTRVHSWNLAVQHQIGDNLGLSATYLGNRMVHVWGDVTGNPATLPAGAAATGPCTLKTTTGTQTFANCSLAPVNLRRELSQLNPAVGALIGYLDYVNDAGWQQYHGLLLSMQQRARNGFSVTANYTLSKCEGVTTNNTGGNPLNVGTGYVEPISLFNPPADVEAKLAADKGHCDNSRTHIFNLTASAETPRFAKTTARLLASGWRLSGIFRATSGNMLGITTGIDRSLDGVVTGTQRVNQVLDNPYGEKTLNNWFNPAAFAQPAIGTTGTSGRNAYLGPGSRTLDLSLVRSFGLQNMHRIEARIEAFNAFNWLRWGDPITVFSDANFGRILTAGDPRILQFAVKYQF